MAGKNRSLFTKEMLVEKEAEPTIKAIVSQARSTLSPMHDCFEWSDEIAATLYRRHFENRSDQGDASGKAIRL